MKAIQINQYGDNSVLPEAEIEIPFIEPNQVLVKLKASAVNPVDYKIRSGFMQAQLPKNFPFTLGWEGAGVITSLGTEIKNYKIGDEVILMPNFLQGGTYAEYVAVNADEIIRKPADLEFENAATLPVAWSTAWTALVKDINIRPQQNILILGAGGAVGKMAVQIAKKYGLNVTGTATGEDIITLETFRIDEVIDYKSTDIASLKKKFDVVLDLVGGEFLKKAYALVKKGGSIISTTQFPDTEMLSKYSIHGKMTFTTMDKTAFDQLFIWLDKDEIQLKSPDIFELHQAKEALALVENRKIKNKIIFKF